MPSRGSGFEHAVVRTTLSPMRITTDPWACLANFPVSIDIDLPPANWTVVSCFMVSSFLFFRRQIGRNIGGPAPRASGYCRLKVGMIEKLPLRRLQCLLPMRSARWNSGGNLFRHMGNERQLSSRAGFTYGCRAFE